jgi:hypothetical protein
MPQRLIGICFSASRCTLVVNHAVAQSQPLVCSRVSLPLLGGQHWAPYLPRVRRTGSVAAASSCSMPSRLFYRITYVGRCEVQSHKKCDGGSSIDEKIVHKSDR